MKAGHEATPGAESLFDLDSRDRVRLATKRPFLIAFVVVALLIAGLVSGIHHDEFPFLAYLLSYCGDAERSFECTYPMALDWLAGGVALAVVGPALALVLKLRPIRPSVTCLVCKGQGWIMDLEKTGGSCPRCGHDGFRFVALEGTRTAAMRAWEINDARGSELLDLRRDRGFL